jgi:hypothetical protein
MNEMYPRSTRAESQVGEVSKRSGDGELGGEAWTLRGAALVTRRMSQVGEASKRSGDGELGGAAQ